MQDCIFFGEAFTGGNQIYGLYSFSNHLCFFLSLNKTAASMCWISTYSLLLQTVNLHSTYGPRSRKMHTWRQKPVFCLLKVEYSDKTLFIGLKFRPTIDRNRTRNMHNVYSTIKRELCRQKKLASGKNRIFTHHISCYFQAW